MRPNQSVLLHSTLFIHYSSLAFKILFFSLMPIWLFGQEENSSDEPKNYEITGYIKQMQTTFFLGGPDALLMDNLIHNRINFDWYINDKWTFKADMRNRIFYGNLVQQTNYLTTLDPNALRYAEQVGDVNNDVLDLSTVLLDRDAIVIHSMIDRLYFDYVNDKLELRVGRQRINWGINLAFNPNDIFNTYSFFDFDYEERPGSDAIKMQYYTGVASSFEIAIKAFDDIDELVAAGLWRINKANYDFQILGGVFNQDVVIGGGWAGNIKNAGFKGEFTTFLPYNDFGNDVDFAGTIGFDYTFDNSMYGYLGILYSTTGTTATLFDTAATNANLGLLSLGGGGTQNAKSLYPYRTAIITQASYPVTPIFNAGLALIYSPSEDNALFVNPTLTLSIKENWDLDLVGQVFFANNPLEDSYGVLSTAVFVRVKWSY